MRQKSIFLLLSVMILLAWALLLFLIYKEGSTTLFYVTEAVTLATLLFLLYFYRKVIKPLDTIATGMHLLREQDFSSRLSSVGQREVDRIVDIFNRMMMQLKDERLRLREQNHFLDLLINASPMGVVILDFNGCVTMMNPAARSIIGDDCMGKVLDKIDSPLIQQISKIKHNDSRIIRCNGIAVYNVSRLSFSDRGFAHPFLLIEHLTEEVHKAERNAYEKVIRMIAHEVNNSMGGITSILGTAKDMLQTDMNETPGIDATEISNALNVCEERGRMLSDFITRFAEVVKIPPPQMQMYDVNSSIRYCARFMEKACSENNITLSLRLCKEPLIVNIDVSLFEQVLVNIVKNSVESIGRDGEIVIETEHNPASVVICDNGKGIDSAFAGQLFTPFFTTKDNGQGIGLMFTREVLTAHGCKFSLATAADGLTRFRIEF